MALEAIYGHDLAVFENIGGLHYFQVSSVAMFFFSIVLVAGTLALMVCHYIPDLHTL